MVSALIVNIASAQFKSASLQASGLTCAMCSKAVKSALEKLSFVQEVKVDIKNQEYKMTFRSGMQPEFDAMKKAVEDAGFSVASLKVTGDFDQVAIAKDAHVSIGGSTLHFLNAKQETLKGEKTITIVDKDFLTAKEYKKYSNASKMECVRTGKAAGCCTKEGIAAETRIYHVII